MKNLSCILLLCVCFFVHAEKVAANHEFILNGTVKGATTTTIYLCYVDAREKFRTDSSHLDQGHFTFKGMIKGSALAFIGLVKKALPLEDDDIGTADGKNATVLFLEPQRMEVELEGSNFKNAVVKGSVSQEQYAAFTTNLKHINDRYKAQNDSVQALNTIDKIHKVEIRARLASIREQAASKALRGFIAQYPASYVTAYLVSTSHFKLDSLKLFYNRLPRAVKQSGYGDDIEEMIARKESVTVGKTAPMFKQATRKGDTINLKDFRGRYVLLQFWSSTNNASRANNKALISVYDQFKDRQFTILGISSDGQKTRAAWLDAVEKDHLPWIELAALKNTHNPAMQRFDVQSIPANFLIDSKGKIAGVDLDADQVRAILAKSLR